MVIDDDPRGTLRLEEKQAAAATGQIRLAHAYQETLARHHITVAQILLTLGDTEERRRHLNARSTLNTLLKMGAVQECRLRRSFQKNGEYLDQMLYAMLATDWRGSLPIATAPAVRVH